MIRVSVYTILTSCAPPKDVFYVLHDNVAETEDDASTLVMIREKTNAYKGKSSTKGKGKGKGKEAKGNKGKDANGGKGKKGKGKQTQTQVAPTATVWSQNSLAGGWGTPATTVEQHITQETTMVHNSNGNSINTVNSSNNMDILAQMRLTMEGFQASMAETMVQTLRTETAGIRSDINQVGQRVDGIEQRLQQIESRRSETNTWGTRQPSNAGQQGNPGNDQGWRQ